MSEKCLILILSTNIILTSTASLPEVNLTETNNTSTKTSTTPIIPPLSTLPTNIFFNKTVSQGVTSKSKLSNVTASPYSQHPPVKPFEGSHTFLFVTIFSMGLIGVIVFYVYKKSSGSLSFGDGRYQYSVLNSNLMDPDDDSNDPLINDFVRNDEDDNFLDISRYRYSDEDDVELLGAGPGEFLCDITSHSPATVASHTQLAASEQGDQGGGGACKNNSISSALLNDSDEELLQ